MNQFFEQLLLRIWRSLQWDSVAAMVIISKNPVRAVLFLVLTFFCYRRDLDVVRSGIFDS